MMGCERNSLLMLSKIFDFFLVKGAMNGAFSVPFFSLNMSAQTEKIWIPPKKKLSPKPLKWQYAGETFYHR